MQSIETVIVAAALLCPLVFRRRGSLTGGAIIRMLSAIAARRKLSVGVVVGVSLFARVAVFPVHGIPDPHVNDEFSYLLAADTFAMGRLANPTHPLWVFFESQHISHVPTYMSMYPPGQGAVLAVGKVIFGHPFWGVWLVSAALCGALVWMLQGWVPPVWALVGGLLCVVRVTTFSYWGGSYWGGSLSATAGCLVLGGLSRLLQCPKVVDALVVGTGIAVLALTRPYEGLVLTISAGLVFFVFLRSGRRAIALSSLLGYIAAAGAPLVLAAAFLAYYDWRVFGNPFSLPYTVNRAQYAVAGVFLWDQPRPEPTYNHPVLRNFYIGWELYHFERARTLPGFFELFAIRLGRLWSFYIGPSLSPLIIAAIAFPQVRRLRPLMWCGALFGIGLTLQAFFSPHYAAPVVGVIYVMLVQGLRFLRLLRLGADKRFGRRLAAGLAAACLLTFALRCVEPFIPLDLSEDEQTWASRNTMLADRAQLARDLDRQGGRHLVLLRYQAKHHPNLQWVYNAADLDAAPIVWAHDMGQDRNSKLLAYFRDRRIWVVQPEVDTPRGFRLREMRCQGDASGPRTCISD